MTCYVTVDLGEQLVEQGGLKYFAYVFILSCGCRVELDRRTLMIHGEVAYRQALGELLRNHGCATKELAP